MQIPSSTINVNNNNLTAYGQKMIKDAEILRYLIYKFMKVFIKN